MDCRYTIDDPSLLLSPSLVIFRDLVRQNLTEMITMARGPDRLRPHVKTHKMAAIVRMAGELGISKHKCATIAETEMVAASGGNDVPLAYPSGGPEANGSRPTRQPSRSPRSWRTCASRCPVP